MHDRATRSVSAARQGPPARSAPGSLFPANYSCSLPEFAHQTIGGTATPVPALIGMQSAGSPATARDRATRRFVVPTLLFVDCVGVNGPRWGARSRVGEIDRRGP